MNRLLKMRSLCVLWLCAIVCLMTGCRDAERAVDGCGGNFVGPADKNVLNHTDTMDVDEAPYEVVIENMTLGQEMPDLAAVEEAVNAITLPAINCTVSIMNIHIADHATKISLMIAGGEKMDLITTGRTVDLSNMVSDGILRPLDDLLAERGRTITEKAGGLLDACRINGSIYTVPGNLYVGMSNGFEYNKDMARQFGIQVSDYMSWDALEDMARTLKAQGIFLMTQGDGGASSLLMSMMNPSLYDIGGTNFIYGVIDDISTNTKIINVFDTEYYRQYCHKMRQWHDNGYIPTDSLLSGESSVDVFMAGRSFMQWTGVSPSELAIQSKSFPFELGMFVQKDGMITTELMQEAGWGISVTSRRPEKAMDFLDFLYGNEAVANLLMNGIEGRQYKKVSEHIITYADGVTAQTLGYQRAFSLFGDTMQIYQWEPATESYYDELKAFTESMEISPLLGYSFDASVVAGEVSAVKNVIDEYMPMLECGVVADVDGSLLEFNKALKTAGIGRIIEANQAQLNDWLRQNR